MMKELTIQNLNILIEKTFDDMARKIAIEIVTEEQKTKKGYE